MRWLQQFEFESTKPLSLPGFPKKVLRHLLFEYGLTLGSRVLAAGCDVAQQDDDNFVWFLNELGIDAIGLTDPVQAAHPTSNRADQFRFQSEFYSGDAVHAIPFAECQFDLIITRRLSAYGSTLFSRSAYRATANLLACLRPGGSLVALSRFDAPGDGADSGHLSSCYARHFAAFPGVRTNWDFPDPLFQRGSWRWIVGKQLRPGFFMNSIQIPSTRHRRNDWLMWAERAAHGAESACCAWSESVQAEQIRNVRFAA